MSYQGYLVLACVLFTIGFFGVLIRRNAIIVFLSIELMLNAANLLFVSASEHWGNLSGQVIAFFVMVVAAAEVVVGLAIIVIIYRTRATSSVDEIDMLKG